MKAASLPNLNRETTSFHNFFTLYQEVDHHHDMTLNERPNIGHGEDSEDSETSPFNDILSLSPLISSNKIEFSAAPRSVMMFRCESEHTTSSVGSNQFSCDSGGARSEGTNPTQMDYYQQPQMSDSQIQLQLLKLQQQRQALLDQQRLFLDPSQSFPRTLAPIQTLDMPQAISDFPGHVSHTPTSNQLATAGTGAWAPAPAPPPSQFQRMLRTYTTKVYKTGSVGRSIDITRYSGYEELRQDLARMFGIEGQLEDRHRVGWKMVYVDRENDVLIFGDDPWEEFVCCVRYIKILSPQEVQAGLF